MTPTSNKPYILSVDDEPVNQLVITGFLQDQYELSFATNGIECLDSVEQRKPDLILMDIHMPRLNGLEACRKIRSNPENRHIPIIFVSTSTREQDRRESMEVGGSDYMHKPFNVNALNSKIHQYLKNGSH
jgi:cyclic di-GMP phosphodiesterase